MRILSLDLGSKTGWAFTRGPAEPIESGTFEVRQERGESGGMRFIRWRAWFEEFLRETKPELVTYEMPIIRGGAASAFLVGLATRVEEITAGAGIEYTKINLTTIKKWGAGSGAASKEAMIAAAVLYAGRAFEDDNEADAWLQAAYAKWRYDKGQPDARRTGLPNCLCTLVPAPEARGKKPIPGTLAAVFEGEERKARKGKPKGGNE